MQHKFYQWWPAAAAPFLNKSPTLWWTKNVKQDQYWVGVLGFKSDNTSMPCARRSTCMRSAPTRITCFALQNARGTSFVKHFSCGLEPRPGSFEKSVPRTFVLQNLPNHINFLFLLVMPQHNFPDIVQLSTHSAPWPTLIFSITSIKNENENQHKFQLDICMVSRYACGSRAY